MPPIRGVEGQMIVSFFTSSGAPSLKANLDWDTLGKWYSNLVGERVDASPEIKQQVEDGEAFMDRYKDVFAALAK